jgi:diguanylate cyclase (GGDEF)-like protein/PAS domain S-box-containing protein
MIEGRGMSTDAELEALRAHMRGIAATLPDVVWSVEIPSHRIVYVSPAVAAVFGKSVEQMSRAFSEWSDSIHPEDRTRVLTAWEATTRGEPFEIEYRVTTAAGDVRFVETRGRASIDAEGRVFRVDGMSRDVTERRAQERKLAQLSRMHAVLSGINGAIGRATDRRALLQDVCRIAVEEGGFRMVWIGLIDMAHRQIRAETHYGFGPEAPGVITIPPAGDPEMQSQLGCRAILEGMPLLDNRIQSASPSNPLRQLALRRGAQSVIALPLMIGDAATGVMILYAPEPDYFTAEEQKLLDGLASDVSLALEYMANEEKLRYLAYYDELTGLPNHALLHKRLTQLLVPAKEGRTHTAVAKADIKRFRLVNETFGRQAGDALLRELAQRLRAHWPEPENLARISADSFALVLSDARDAVNIASVLEKYFDAVLAEPFVIGGREIRMAMSVGVAVAPPDGEEPDALFSNAEAACKRSKASGDRLVFYHPEMNARVAETLLLENRLRHAAEQDQFVLHYQPKVAAGTGQVTGLEALIRWRDPEHGLVQPSKFIPILEETGMILGVGAWAIRKALAESRDWRLTHTGPLRIAVNVSPVQLGRPDFVDTVKRALDGLGIAATQLDLEITETMIMMNVEENVKKLAEIRRMGINIAVDDFGTGYSSLAYLAKLPVNALKIDKSFVATMTSDAQSMTLVSTIISLAHALDLKVIAEGVESHDQAKLLRLLKCDEMQGFLFGRPLPAEDVQDFLRGSQIRTASR